MAFKDTLDKLIASVDALADKKLAMEAAAEAHQAAQSAYAKVMEETSELHDQVRTYMSSVIPAANAGDRR